MNSSGKLIEKTRYDPFGAELSGGNKSKYGYNGKEEDSTTGLLYYGARYYNPRLKRWTQPDPMIQDIYDPQSLNRYSYVKNNPMKYTDPDGFVAVQIGVAGNYGKNIFRLFGPCVSGGAGIAITHDEKEGWQLGVYGQLGVGGFAGEQGGAVSGETTVTPSAKTVEEVGGLSVSGAVRVFEKEGIGGGVSVPLNIDLDKRKIDIDISKPSGFVDWPGVGAESVGQILVSNTWTWTLYKEKNNEDASVKQDQNTQNSNSQNQNANNNKKDSANKYTGDENDNLISQFIHLIFGEKT